MKRVLPPDVIIAAVSGSHGVSPADIMGRKRTKRIAQARQSVMLWLRSDGRTLQEIADILQRDHSTVLHGIRRAALKAVEGGEG